MPAITDGSDDETKALHIALRYAIHYSGELRDKSNAALLKAANNILTKLEAGIAPKTEREMLMAARNSFVATVNEMHAAAHGVPIGPNGEIEGAVEPVLGLVEDVEALYARASRAEKERDEALKAARTAATHAADAISFAGRMEKERVDYSECRADNAKLRAQVAAMRAAPKGSMWLRGACTKHCGETAGAAFPCPKCDTPMPANAGRDILDALAKAEATAIDFMAMRATHGENDFDRRLGETTKRVQEVLDAIQALGLKP